MDDDWEALAEKDNVVIAPKIQNINKWEGEDEDEDVKDSWEDEEEKKDEEKVKEEVKPIKAKPKKPLQTRVSERSDEEKLDKEAIEELSPEDKLAEKLRLQKIQEEEDLKTAMDTFGVTEQPSGIDGIHPTSKTEFSEFAEAISNKVSVYKAAEEFPGFVEELMRSICANLQASDLKKIKITVDNLYVEKQKIEKEKTKKPAGKGKTKVKLRVEEDEVKANTIGDYGYDYDYDDFM